MKNFGPPTYGDVDLVAKQEIVEERRWGYILNAPGMTYAQLSMSQRLAVLTCAYLLSFAIGCVPPIFQGETDGIDPISAGAALFFIALSVPFAWYATRGTRAYVYVNLYRSELREVVPNMIGKPTILRRIPFADIGGVRIDHGGSGERAMLLLWQGGEWRRIAVLDGRRKELTCLREKLAKDLFSKQLNEVIRNPANIAGLPAMYRRTTAQQRRLA